MGILQDPVSEEDLDWLLEEFEANALTVRNDYGDKEIDESIQRAKKIIEKVKTLNIVRQKASPKITHYGLFRPDVPGSPAIKEAAFFRSQGGLEKRWGRSWEPIEDATSIGDARRKMAEKYGVKLSHIYMDEK